MKRTSRWWDEYFLGMAEYVSRASKDTSTKTGAVIISPNQVLISTGYNGFPQGMPDFDVLYADREEKYSRIVHCEVNAVLFARQPLQGCTLYTHPFASCDRCVVQMLQAGIKRFVFPTPSADALTRWASAFEKTKRYITECGATYEEITL